MAHKDIRRDVNWYEAVGHPISEFLIRSVVRPHNKKEKTMNAKAGYGLLLHRLLVINYLVIVDDYRNVETTHHCSTVWLNEAIFR